MNISKGHIIGGYKLTEIIGRGGTATVWSVSKIRNSKEAKEQALKIFNSELIMHKKSLYEIQNQYNRQKAINHPNILSPLEIFDNEGVPAILFEKAEMSLQQLLQEKRHSTGFNENQLVDILGDITSGLIHLHNEEDLAHNDVKTDNILVFKVGEEYSYKLCDLDTSVSLRATIMLRLTTRLDRNDIYFTPLYVAPEKKNSVASNTKTYYDNKKSDVFSLGATILELCTPLDIPVEQMIKQGTLTQTINSLHVSKRMKELLTSMLHEYPELRLSLSDVNKKVSFRQNFGFWPEAEEENNIIYNTDTQANPNGQYSINSDSQNNSKSKNVFYISILILVFIAFCAFMMAYYASSSIFENYSTHTNIKNGYACVCNSKCGVINEKGKIMQALQYSNCENNHLQIILDQDTFLIQNKTLIKLN